MSALEAWTLANGLSVLYRHDARFPLAQASLLFATGSRKEKRPEAGLSSMTIDLLTQGTRRRSARAIARVMEAVGATLGTQAHEDCAELGFVVPAAEIARALDLTSEVLREPSFPREEITKEKAHVLADLSSRRDAIFNLAYDHLNRALYGDHPYGRPLEGEEKAVRRFARRDFIRWHQAEIRPEGAVLSMIAPLSPRTARAKIERSLAKWHPAPAAPSAALARPPHPLRKSISRPISSSFQQAYLMLGWQAPGADHPDHVPLKVLNTLLGGGMSSRLFVTLREELGLAYEVSSFYPTRIDTSQWVVYLGLPKEKLKTASERLSRLLEQVARRGPRPEELAQAKAMIRGAFLMDRQSRRRQAWYHAWWEFLGRGPDYGDKFLEAVDATSADTVQNLMKRVLQQPCVTVTVTPK